jgi:hypothetical protein
VDFREPLRGRFATRARCALLIPRRQYLLGAGVRRFPAQTQVGLGLVNARRVVVGCSRSSALVGCAESTGSAYGEPSTLPVESNEWELWRPASFRDGTLHVGERTVELGDRVDQFVLGRHRRLLDAWPDAHVHQRGGPYPDGRGRALGQPGGLRGPLGARDRGPVTWPDRRLRHPRPPGGGVRHPHRGAALPQTRRGAGRRRRSGRPVRRDHAAARFERHCRPNTATTPTSRKRPMWPRSPDCLHRLRRSLRTSPIRSSDGSSWRFVRLFRLGTGRDVHTGFMAQAPLGERCAAHVSSIRVRRALAVRSQGRKPVQGKRPVNGSKSAPGRRARRGRRFR